jgi:hypothetical protein
LPNPETWTITSVGSFSERSTKTVFLFALEKKREGMWIEMFFFFLPKRYDEALRAAEMNENQLRENKLVDIGEKYLEVCLLQAFFAFLSG